MPDVVVIGAGIAGLSAAAELACEADTVRVVEMEATPAHHATGRSAALYIPSYGPPHVRTLTLASRAFFESSDEARCASSLLSKRDVMYASDEASLQELDHLVAEVTDAGGALEPLDADEAEQRCPALRSSWVAAAALDTDAHDLDVAALVGLYRSVLSERGGHIDVNSRVVGITPRRDRWQVSTTSGSIEADLLVNAAGAWVDEVAVLAGLDPLGFEPRRRTLAIAKPTGDAAPGSGFIADAAERFYFGSEPGGVIFSPADVTPSPPCDARPEEIDVAYAMDQINQATTLGLRSLRSAWAGLRTFSPDGELVIGPDPAAPTFVWCGGQGGYGIQTSFAAGRATAALTLGGPLPTELVELGLAPEHLSPSRLRQ